ncbi:hypothetical protein J6R97_07970 [bacterium]|nr:hypothetical protein [bacterium]
MFSRRNLVLILTIVSIAFLCSGCASKKETMTQDLLSQVNTKPAITKVAAEQPIKEEPKYDLYTSTLYDLPLFSILEISKLSKEVKAKIDEILEAAQGFYLLRTLGDGNVFIVLQNPINTLNTYQRHNLQFLEIDKQGIITFHNAGYSGIDGEIYNAITDHQDLWVFDETIEPFRPLKHISYDEKGKVRYTELWDYDTANPVKYQMLDSKKKLISILKESQDNDFNLRKEHVFYDNDGIVKMSLSINYEGANITRLNFYNSNDLIEGITILSEYIDGFKVKESIYDESFLHKFTVIADYKENERKAVKLYDIEGNIVKSISN